MQRLVRADDPSAAEALLQRGDHIWNVAFGYMPTEKVKISFIMKNVLNWEYTPRMAYYDPPRGYTLQATYTF